MKSEFHYLKNAYHLGLIFQAKNSKFKHFNQITI